MCFLSNAVKLTRECFRGYETLEGLFSWVVVELFLQVSLKKTFSLYWFSILFEFHIGH